jgi:PhnB protein
MVAYLKGGNMQSTLNPYLEFDGNARQAMEFYQSVFGGELTVSTYQEYQMAENPADAGKIMHSQLLTENRILLMGADTPNRLEYQPTSNISISLSGDNFDELKGYYEKLIVDGTVLEPLVTAPWGDTFGMLKDQFGVKWMVNISGAKQ